MVSPKERVLKENRISKSNPQAIAMITDQKNEQTLPKDIEIEG